MKTGAVLLLLLGLAASTHLPFNFTVFGIGDPAVYYQYREHSNQYQYFPSYNNLLLSTKIYLNKKLRNHLLTPLHNFLQNYRRQSTANIHRNVNYYKPFSYREYANIQPYFRPYNPDHEFKPPQNPDLHNIYASKIHSRFVPQNLKQINRRFVSRLLPFFSLHNLVHHPHNHLHNRLSAKTYVNVHDIRSGPIIVLTRATDPSKLVAVLVQHGLESLGRYSNTKPLVEALKTSVGVKTAFLFSPVNPPATSWKLPISSFILPSGMSLAQLANMAVLAYRIPNLLLVDDNSPWFSEIKYSSQTFEIGRVQAINNVINIISQLPVHPVQPGHNWPVALPSAVSTETTSVPVYRPSGISASVSTSPQVISPTSSSSAVSSTAMGLNQTATVPPSSLNQATSPSVSTTSGGTHANFNQNLSSASSSHDKHKPQSLSTSSGETHANLNQNLSSASSSHDKHKPSSLSTSSGQTHANLNQNLSSASSSHDKHKPSSLSTSSGETHANLNQNLSSASSSHDKHKPSSLSTSSGQTHANLNQNLSSASSSHDKHKPSSLSTSSGETHANLNQNLSSASSSHDKHKPSSLSTSSGETHANLNQNLSSASSSHDKHKPQSLSTSSGETHANLNQNLSSASSSHDKHKPSSLSTSSGQTHANLNQNLSSASSSHDKHKPVSSS